MRLRCLFALGCLVAGSAAQHTQEAVRSFRKGDYLYFQRTLQPEDGSSTQQHCRCQGFASSGATGGRCGAESDVEVLLDESTLDARLSGLAVSPDHQLLAYTHTSSAAADGAPAAYGVTIKNIDTGAVRSDKLRAAHPKLVWGVGADGGQVLYYIKPDHSDGRAAELWRHVPGGSDDLLLREDDVAFQLALTQTTDERWLLVNVESSDTSEVHILRLDEPKSEAGQKLQMVAERKPNTKYEVDIRHESHLTDWHRKIYQSTVYIRTNWAPIVPGKNPKDIAKVYRMMRVGLTDITRGMSKWRGVGCLNRKICTAAFPYDPNRDITGMKVFKGHLVVQGVEIEGEMRAHKIWVVELTDDDRATRIYEMARPGSGALLSKGQSLLIDEMQGYESDAVRLRLMAPSGKDVAPTEKEGVSTYELPFPPPSGIGSSQAEYSATVQEMFKGENAEAFPILEDIALVDEAFKSKPSGTKQKQEL